MAKPSGILLKDHTQNVENERADILSARPFLTQKFRNLTGLDLSSLTKIATYWHDQGKRHPTWQTACRKDYETYRATGKEDGKELLKGDLRHEFASLDYLKGHSSFSNTHESVLASIAAHHGKLGKRFEAKWDKQGYKEWWKCFWKQGAKFSTSDPFAEPMPGFSGLDNVIQERYLYDGVRSVLRLADHRASARESYYHRQSTQPERTGKNFLPPALEPFVYEYPHPEKRGVQLLVPQFQDRQFTLLRAPTGAGKTDTALLWAKHQINEGRADRLVWVMPTRFTSNALYMSRIEEVSSTGIYHSSAWSKVKNQKQSNGQYKEINWKDRLHYAQLLEAPTTITTVDQLCLSLTGAREDHHATFWNLAHSCVVFDESDFYDDFTQQNILVLLRVLFVLKVPVLLMSATLPESVVTFYEQSGVTAGPIFEDTSDLSRERFFLHHAGEAEQPENLRDLLQRGLDGEAMIIYANTVARAQAYYDWFLKEGAKDVILYHSRFTEPDKEVLEKTLLSKLGPDAWKAQNPPRTIAVLTQIGELSVNISADLMVSDLCPIDRLAQRAGRLSRFRNANGQYNVGELHLVYPMRTQKDKGKLFYPAPYGHYKTGTGWTASPVLENSKEMLEEGPYTAELLVQKVNKLYPETTAPSREAKDNRQLLERTLTNNWLVLPQALSEEESDDLGWKDWRSRDISPQKIVYVNVDTSGIDFGADLVFRNSSHFREWALEHAVSVSEWDFKIARTQQKIEPVTVLIDGDAETVFIVRKEYYSSETGLNFYATEPEE